MSPPTPFIRYRHRAGGGGGGGVSPVSSCSAALHQYGGRGRGPAYCAGVAPYDPALGADLFATDADDARMMVRRQRGGVVGVVVSGVRRMNEVNARRARLVPGWVTVFGRVYRLGM